MDSPGIGFNKSDALPQASRIEDFAKKMNVEELLIAQFPGRLYVSVFEAGTAIGYKRSTTTQLCREKKFPLQITKVGMRRMIALTEIARFMKSNEQNNQPDPEPNSSSPSRAV